MRSVLLLAAAAVLPLTAAPAMAQQTWGYDWTGPYVGVNIGQGRNADFDLDALLQIDGDSNFFPEALHGRDFPTLRVFDGDGLIAGVQGGYNVQMDSFVFGLEADIQYSDIEKDIAIPNAPGGADDNPDGFTDLNFNIDYYSTLRGRAGFAWDRFMVYATAGGAFGNVDFDRNYRVGSSEITASASNTRFGWTYGGGVEFAVSEFWTVRGEYMKVDLGSDTFNTTYSDGTVGLATIDTEFDVIRAGVNLRF